MRLRVGANGRRYTPDSDGTIFNDPDSVVITNQEIGVYAWSPKAFLRGQTDHDGNHPNGQKRELPVRVFPSRFLCLEPQFEELLAIECELCPPKPHAGGPVFGPRRGASHLGRKPQRADSALTSLETFQAYRESSAGLNIGLDRSIVGDNRFSIDAIRPERVRTVEMGYRTTIGESLYLDMNAYRSWYEDFIGYIIALDVDFWESGLLENTVKSVDVYRYAANSLNQVQTQGASLGFNWFIDDHFTLNGNYSWNKLVKTDEDDPIIPAFNTPEHKYNAGLTARGSPRKTKTLGVSASTTVGCRASCSRDRRSSRDLFL